MKLGNRIKELIAIGTSITGICHPCLQYHLEKAGEYGAKEQEIREAITVGKTVRKGAAKMDAFASSHCPGHRPPRAFPAARDVAAHCKGGCGYAE